MKPQLKEISIGDDLAHIKGTSALKLERFEKISRVINPNTTVNSPKLLQF